MSYDYRQERAALFTEEGQTTFIKMRDAVLDAIQLTGAIMLGKAMGLPVCGVPPGDTFLRAACLDRMVEMGDLREVSAGSWTTRIFVKA